jgi:hypothetical protein
MAEFFTKVALGARYKVTTRSIDRWIEAGLFPKPDIHLPNGWPAWASATIEQHERTLVAKPARKPIEETAAA